MSNSKKIPLAGSERTALAGARVLGPTDPHQLIEVSLVLRHREALPAASSIKQHLTHEEFASRYGAHPDDIALIRKFAKEYKLQVLERGDEMLRRTIALAGTAANMERAFGVELNEYEHPEGSYRGRTGPVNLPEEITPIVTGVLGLDDRPVAHPHFRCQTHSGAFGVRAMGTSYNPTEIATMYGFPTDVNGSGQSIAILELGGGFRPADLKHYFTKLGLKAPTVKAVLVDHAHNRPTNANSADGEVMLDIEVAGAVAPGANIVVYFAPNTTRGFQDALSMAIHDQLNRPSVVSISWGGPENTWTTQSMKNFDQVAQEAALLGVTITVASGDSGSSDGVNDGKNHVDFPASSPHVLATGGTRLVGQNGVITQEVVWNDGGNGGATGGGYSTIFSRPDWQAASVTQLYRGVPDVAGDADPASGYNVLVDGHSMVIGGTSAVAPLWAGLIALCNQKLNRRLGFLNPILYGMNQSDGFHDITDGNNGAFTASPGWDACTGCGSPNATKLLASLKKAPAQTASSITKPTLAGAD